MEITPGDHQPRLELLFSVMNCSLNPVHGTLLTAQRRAGRNPHHYVVGLKGVPRSTAVDLQPWDKEQGGVPLARPSNLNSGYNPWTGLIIVEYGVQHIETCRLMSHLSTGKLAYIWQRVEIVIPDAVRDCLQPSGFRPISGGFSFSHPNGFRVGLTPNLMPGPDFVSCRQMATDKVNCFRLLEILRCDFRVAPNITLFS